MSKIDFANLFRNLKMSFTKHAPEILTGVGITGMITSTILAVKGTPKAITLFQEASSLSKTNSIPLILPACLE